MTAGGNGDEGRRTPVDTSPKQVVRTSDEHAAGDSTTMGAADTAIALAVSSSSAGATEPDVVGSGPGVAAAVTRADVAADELDLVGTTLLDRYQITKKIGQGGMGAVYEATHSLIGKRVAVKVLLDKYAKKDQVVARLEQEARLASSIGHEHIIDITDFGITADGRTFVVMEFLEGESLAECLAREATLPEQRILHVAQQIAGALAAAHAKGVVHRDVKPENVFLLRRKDRDFVKVVDFGISKSLRSTGDGADSPRLTQTGMVLGTPLYMSPEQARGDDHLDHRIDIYALGVIMYELATGKVPFSGSNYLSVISQVLNDEPVRPRQLRPDLTEEFEAVILRALEKDRDRRYQSADELIADLHALLDDPMRSTQRPRILAPRRWRPRIPATKVMLWVVGISVVIAAVAVSVSMMMGGAASKPVAATVDATPPSRVAVDAGAEAVAVVVPDAAPAVRPVEIWVDTVPSKAQIYDHDKGKNLGRSPTAIEVFPDTPIKLEAELDGYETHVFVVDPAQIKATTKAKPFKVKLTRKGRTGGGSTPRPDAGGVKPPPDKIPDGPCADGLPRNPVTHKCPGER
jgi:eukaryotic-like serine/threonine-protein kinase